MSRSRRLIKMHLDGIIDLEGQTRDQIINWFSDNGLENMSYSTIGYAKTNLESAIVTDYMNRWKR